MVEFVSRVERYFPGLLRKSQTHHLIIDYDGVIRHHLLYWEMMTSIEKVLHDKCFKLQIPIAAGSLHFLTEFNIADLSLLLPAMSIKQDRGVGASHQSSNSLECFENNKSLLFVAIVLASLGKS